MAFRGAFDCPRCPQTSDPAAKRACPAWWETLWTNPAGETKVEKGCGWRQLPHLLNAIAQSANGAAVSAQHMREAAISAMKLSAVSVMNESPYLISDASVRRRGPGGSTAVEVDHGDVSEGGRGGE